MELYNCSHTRCTATVAMWTATRFWLFGLVLCVYLEPPVIAYLGELCPNNAVGYTDRLDTLLEPLHVGLTLHPALSSLWLAGYYGAFLVHTYSVVYKKVTRNEGELLLRELGLLVLLSVFLHAMSCGNRTATILSTGQLAAETILAPSHAVPNAWFAPRLAWSLLLVQQRRLKALLLVLLLILVWGAGAMLHQLDTRTFVVSCAAAWTLVPPRVAAEEYKHVNDPTHDAEDANKTSVFTINSATHSGADDAEDSDDPALAPYTGETELKTDHDGMAVIDLRPNGTPLPHHTLRAVGAEEEDALP